MYSSLSLKPTPYVTARPCRTRCGMEKCWSPRSYKCTCDLQCKCKPPKMDESSVHTIYWPQRQSNKVNCRVCVSDQIWVITMPAAAQFLIELPYIFVQTVLYCEFQTHAFGLTSVWQEFRALLVQNDTKRYTLWRQAWASQSCICRVPRGCWAFFMSKFTLWSYVNLYAENLWRRNNQTSGFHMWELKQNTQWTSVVLCYTQTWWIQYIRVLGGGENFMKSNFLAAVITYFCIYFIIDAGKFFWWDSCSSAKRLLSASISYPLLGT